MSPKGVHYIVEVSGCDDTITNVSKLQDILVEAANRAHAQVWSVSFNKFPPMERYFNTLKTEHIYLHEYEDEYSLYRAVEEFAYVHYNHVRPHTYNNPRTPFEARVKISRRCYKNT